MAVEGANAPDRAIADTFRASATSRTPASAVDAAGSAGPAVDTTAGSPVDAAAGPAVDTTAGSAMDTTAGSGTSCTESATTAFAMAAAVRVFVGAEERAGPGAVVAVRLRASSTCRGAARLRRATSCYRDVYRVRGRRTVMSDNGPFGFD